MIQNQWQLPLSRLHYASGIAQEWGQIDHFSDALWPVYEQALVVYLASRDESLPVPKRYAYQTESRQQFLALREQGDRHLATSFALIRLQLEEGNAQAVRQEIDSTVQLMPWLTKPLPSEVNIKVNRPFLAPTPSCENRLIENDLGDWLQWAIVQSFAAVDQISFH